MAKRTRKAGPTPRRGTTTITRGGLHRKTVYFDDAEWDAIRRAAFEQQRPYTAIVREAVRRVLRIGRQGAPGKGSRRDGSE
jgi:hypothetical protein